jgi:branched-chain amino acid aminotransferase
MAPNTFPALAKSGANYMNSQLIKMEALLDGYAEGVALNIRGHISEGSGENIFLVQNGAVYTPPLSSSILPGITRDSVITLIRELGMRLLEETIPRELLYIADEVFFTGSAAEITPIRSIDKIIIGSGRRGPVVEKLQRAFFDYIDGRRDDTHHWLTFV